MKKIRIVADINGDIPQELVEKYQMIILPQYYRFERDDKVYGDEEKLEPSAFFKRLDQGERAFSMGCNPGRVRDILEELVQAEEEILCVMFSSALSGSYNTTCMVAEQLREEYPECKIKVIDSLNASFAQGLLAYRAAKSAFEGTAFEEIVKTVQDEIPRMNLWFAVGDLKYLVQGGRLSNMSACIGTVLDIKPILTVNEMGQIVAKNKVRTMKKAVQFMTEMVREKQGGYGQMGIVHADNESLAQEMREELLKEAPRGVEEIFISRINPTIGAHIGPHAVGVVFLQ